MGTPGVMEKGLNHSEKGNDVDPSKLGPAECTEHDSQNLSDHAVSQSVWLVSPGSLHSKLTTVKFSLDMVPKIDVLA